MACAPGHPVMKRVIEGVSSIEKESSQCSINNSTSLDRVTQKMLLNAPIFGMTGPHAYTSAIMAASKSSSTTKSTATFNGFSSGLKGERRRVFKYDHAGNHFKDYLSALFLNPRGLCNCNSTAAKKIKC